MLLTENDLIYRRAILPGEDFIGYMMTLPFLGAKRYKNTAIWGSPSCTSFHPLNLEDVCQRFPSMLPAVEAIVMKHTRYPLYQSVLGERHLDNLYSEYCGSVHRSRGSAGRISVSAPSRRAVCRSCIRQDNLKNGFATWRTEHLVPGALVCPRHRESLFVRCESCNAKAEGQWGIGLACLCGGNLVPVKGIDDRGIDVACDVAAMISELFDARRPFGLTEEVISRALRQQFANARAISRAPILELSAQTELRLTTDFARHLKISVKTWRAFFIEKNGRSLPSCPVRTTAICYAMFGSWARVMEVGGAGAGDCSSLDRHRRNFRLTKSTDTVRSRVRELIAKQNDDEAEAMLDRCRKWVVEQIRVNPSVTRTELRGLPLGWGRIRYLVAVDAEWFDSVLPRVVSHHPNKLAERHGSIAEQIRHRRERATIADPDVRISRKYLSRGLCYESLGKRSAEVAAALEECVESIGSFRRRRIRKLAAKVRSVAPDSRYADASAWDGDCKRQYALFMAGVKRCLSRPKK